MSARASLFICGCGGALLGGCKDLYDGAFILFAGSSEESGAGGMFEDFPYSIVHFGGTFEIFGCSDFARDGLTLKR